MENKYKELEKISKGTYGETFKVEYNDIYFCKKVYIIDDYRYGYTDDFIREVLLLNGNITSLHLHDINNQIIHEDSIFIIVELYNYTLSDFIVNKQFAAKHLTSIQITNIIPSLLRQLYNVHKVGFIHSDLKLDNILEKKGDICICDWGLSEFYGYPKQKKTFQCSRYYKANDERLSINVDLFSLGVSIYYLFTGISLGYKDTIINDDIERKGFHLKKRLTINEYNILKELIKKEIDRPSAKRILMTYYNFIPTYTDNNFDQIIQIINNNDNIMINQCYLHDDVFLVRSNLKRVKYENYTYYDIIHTKPYELEYLDDTFTHFYNANLQFTKKKINEYALLKFLKYYFLSYININTIFMSINIFNLIQENIDFNKYRLSDIVKITINYSCKILESSSYNIKLKNMELGNIKDIEIIILNLFQNKNIEFIPYTFYIYYYITKIIQKYSQLYKQELQRLETICLSILFIVLVNFAELNIINLHTLSLNIVIQSIYFIKNNKLDMENNLCKCILHNSRLIPKSYITSVVEDLYLRKYLY
jgi:serine/threonine protein kinase